MIDDSHRSNSRPRRVSRRGSTGQQQHQPIEDIVLSSPLLAVDTCTPVLSTTPAKENRPTTRRERRGSLDTSQRRGSLDSSSKTGRSGSSKQLQGRSSRRSSGNRLGHHSESMGDMTMNASSNTHHRSSSRPRRSSGRRNSGEAGRTSRKNMRRVSSNDQPKTKSASPGSPLARSKTSPVLTTLSTGRQRRRISIRGATKQQQQQQQQPQDDSPTQAFKKFVSRDSFGENIFALDPSKAMENTAFELGDFDNFTWGEVSAPRRNHIDLLCNDDNDDEAAAETITKPVVAGKSTATSNHKSIRRHKPHASKESLLLSRETLQASCNLRF